MKTKKCPVCKGWKTTTNQQFTSGHIKRKAAHELLDYYLGLRQDYPHAAWMKKKGRIDKKFHFSYASDTKKPA